MDFEALSNSELISVLDQKRKQLRWAKLGIAGSIVMTLALVGLVYTSSVKTFLNQGIEETLVKATPQLVELVPSLHQQALAKVRQVQPVFTSEWDRVYALERPNYEVLVANELELMKNDLEQKWPEFLLELEKLEASQSEILNSELAKILPKDKAESIALDYTNRFRDLSRQQLTLHFREHIAVGGELGKSLYALSQSEPDIPEDIDVNELIGITFELIGKEFQLLAKG